MSLRGWHAGEQHVHAQTAVTSSVVHAYTWISGDMPEQHRRFHSDENAVKFLPLTVLDEAGRPWGCVLAGDPDRLPTATNGSAVGKQTRFVESPTDTTLIMRAKLWAGDPLLGIIGKVDWDGGRALVAGLGIEFETRRRNKFAGRITRLSLDGEDERNVRLDVDVNQAIGNCPKYITTRTLDPYPHANPTITHNVPHLAPTDALPQSVVDFILGCDTVFIGSSYAASKEETARGFPSHVGMNQRGGRKGFVRVGGGGRIVVVPDYSGNRLYTTLGSIQHTPLASLTFISFTSGAILYLTGVAHNHFGDAARAWMPMHSGVGPVTTVEVTGFVFVRDALPWRSGRLGDGVKGEEERVEQEEEREISPYSPPVRFLAEEMSTHAPARMLTDSGLESDANSKSNALLVKIDVHSSTLATFTWVVELPSSSNANSKDAFRIVPGQAAIMDMSALVGEKVYAHMKEGRPGDVNDDRVRTWSVSSFGTSSSSLPSSKMTTQTLTFTTTLRHKPGGLVTSALFAIARKMAQLRPELLSDATPLGMRVGFRGVVGGFVLPSATGFRFSNSTTTEASTEGKDTEVVKLLWIAGGVGITPFLGMLDGILQNQVVLGDVGEVDVRLVLVTREPEAMLGLVKGVMSKVPAGENRGRARVMLRLHVFSSSSSPPFSSLVSTREMETPNDDGVSIMVESVERGRLTGKFFTRERVHGRVVYVCGPEGVERLVGGVLGVEGGRELGVVGEVEREGFSY